MPQQARDSPSIYIASEPIAISHQPAWQVPI
jgi:hypothetical protein